MHSILQSPWRASLLGLAIAVLLIVYAAMDAGAQDAGTLGLRALHVFAAMVWAGFVVFVNFVQHPAVLAVEPEQRPLIIRHIAGPSARVFTGAAHATLATGLVMLIPLGAGLPYRPLLLASVLGGLAMWAIVQFILRPNVARVTGKVAASDAEKAAARAAIATWARVNLILVIPVSVAMLIAAHTGL